MIDQSNEVFVSTGGTEELSRCKNDNLPLSVAKHKEFIAEKNYFERFRALVEHSVIWCQTWCQTSVWSLWILYLLKTVNIYSVFWSVEL